MLPSATSARWYRGFRITRIVILNNKSSAPQARFVLNANARGRDMSIPSPIEGFNHRLSGRDPDGQVWREKKTSNFYGRKKTAPLHPPHPTQIHPKPPKTSKIAPTTIRFYVLSSGRLSIRWGALPPPFGGGSRAPHRIDSRPHHRIDSRPHHRIDSRPDDKT